MAYHSETTFTFGPEHGARLRKLRKSRGLTLRALALLMDRQGANAYTQLARLERGKVRFPSLNLIADYLRACGAGFDRLLDLLNPYTSQEPVLKQKGDAAVAELVKSLPKREQRAMLRWEKATTEKREEKTAAEPKKKRRVETDRQRVFRIIWSFVHANWNEVFEQRLYETMRKFKDEVPRSRRKQACEHSRRMFGILTRYYRHETRRQNALERIRRRAIEDGFSDRLVTALEQAAAQTREELDASGRLDWQPTQEEIIQRRGHAPKVERAETRLELDEIEPGVQYNKMLRLILTMAALAVNARMEKLKLDHFLVRKHYYPWVERLIPIAARHGTESPEWQAEVDTTAPKMHDEAFAREAAAIAASTFNSWKAKLPKQGRPTGTGC